MDTHIDFLAVGIAAVIYTIVFSVWYSRYLFGTAAEKKDRWVRMLSHFILGFVISYFLAFFDAHLNVTSVADGMFVAFCIWLGFIVPTQLFPVIWHKKSVRMFFIETGARLLALLAMGGIIGA